MREFYFINRLTRDGEARAHARTLPDFEGTYVVPDKSQAEAFMDLKLMDLKDAQIQEEQRRGQKTAEQQSVAGFGSKRGGFRNHPDDPNNPNQVRERYLQKIRSLRLS